jgi:hypothetical protein
MNRRRAEHVQAPIRHPARVRRLAAGLVALAAALGTGCVDIDGGAVELSWSLRTFGGSAVESCSEAAIRDIRLCWEPLADGATTTEGAVCRAGQRRRFSCAESSGVTGFDLDPGATAFWIEPVCDDGAAADPGTYEVPPPIVRTVQEGKIISLTSLLLVVSPAGGDCPAGGCTCERR